MYSSCGQPELHSAAFGCSGVIISLAEVQDETPGSNKQGM
jgi:hypothetical protein